MKDRLFVVADGFIFDRSDGLPVVGHHTVAKAERARMYPIVLWVGVCVLGHTEEGYRSRFLVVHSSHDFCHDRKVIWIPNVVPWLVSQTRGMTR